MSKEYPYQLPHEGLKAIVGEENVINDPILTLAYSRDWLPPGILNPMCPEFVVLPGSVEEAQQVIKLCNRYKLPFIPVGSNLWGITTTPNRPGTVLIDPKRLNRIVELDEKNMFAVIEPYVTHAQLHAEAYKRGLYIGSPEAGSQASSLANHCFQAIWGVGHRTNMGYRNILSMDWVLPNGELLRTGSNALAEAGHFNGEGPGPDLRGMLRAFTGMLGGTGMVVRMAVKLHPWPGPKQWPVEGIAPNYRSVLPEDRFEWVLFTYPTMEKMVEAMYEIGKAEIAGCLHHWSTVYMNWWWANSNEEYWNTWKSELFQKNCKNLLGCCLWGFTSPKQLEYEKRVLQDIIEETGGKLIPQEIYDMWVPTTANNWIRDTNGPRMFRPSGNFLALMLLGDTYQSSLYYLKAGHNVMDKYTPPIIDNDHSDWIASYEMGHFAHCEVDFPIEKTIEGTKAFMSAAMEELQRELAARECSDTFAILGGPYHKLAGDVYGYGRFIEGIKRAIDPNNVSNPPHPYPLEG